MSDPCQQKGTINDIDATIHSLQTGLSKQEGWFKASGTLATGTVDAKVFVLAFISDGTQLIEMSRTAAL